MFQVKVVEEIKIHILCTVTFFRKSCVKEVMWKNVVERGSTQITIWHDACALHAAKLRQEYTYTHTHSEYVILIAFPLQQWLRERDSMLRYTCIS